MEKTLTQLKKEGRSITAKSIEMWTRKTDDVTWLEIYNALTGEWETYKLYNKGKDEEPKDTEECFGANGFKRRRLVEQSLVEAEN